MSLPTEPSPLRPSDDSVARDRPAAAEVRTGSPFAVDPSASSAASHAVAGERGSPLESGVANEMARGGTLAGGLLILFAAPCVWGFPFGGVLIAGLGSLLSLWGCAGAHPRWAIGSLLIHLSLLAVASLRWLEIAR